MAKHVIGVMRSNITIAVRSVSLLSSFIMASCQIHGVLKPEDLKTENPNIFVSSIDLSDGRTVHFDKDSLGLACRHDSVVSRALPSGQVEAYTLSQIVKIHTVRRSTTAEDVSTAIALGAASILIVAVLIGTIHISVGG